VEFCERLKDPDKEVIYDCPGGGSLGQLLRALDYEFDAETKSAWEQMLCAVATVMLEGQGPHAPGEGAAR